MIPLSEINLYADQFQVPAETIEKDYVISWILLLLSRSKLRNQFIFYGGTAIKRIYFEDHRFSEDIDLISANFYTQKYVLEELEILQCARDEANLILSINPDKINVHKDRIQLFVEYSGFDEIMGASKEIRMDFSMNMHLFGDISDKSIISTYSDIITSNTSLIVMTVNTILANKLGLLLDSTRNEPRDLYDIWFLLQRTDKFDFDFYLICKIFKEKYGFHPIYSILSSRLNNPSFILNWGNRLNKQMAMLPDVKLIISEIKEQLKKLFSDMKS